MPTMMLRLRKERPRTVPWHRDTAGRFIKQRTFVQCQNKYIKKRTCEICAIDFSDSLFLHDCIILVVLCFSRDYFAFLNSKLIYTCNVKKHVQAMCIHDAGRMFFTGFVFIEFPHYYYFFRRSFGTPEYGSRISRWISRFLVSRCLPCKALPWSISMHFNRKRFERFFQTLASNWAWKTRGAFWVLWKIHHWGWLGFLSVIPKRCGIPTSIVQKTGSFIGSYKVWFEACMVYIFCLVMIFIYIMNTCSTCSTILTFMQ